MQTVCHTQRQTVWHTQRQTVRHITYRGRQCGPKRWIELHNAHGYRPKSTDEWDCTKRLHKNGNGEEAARGDKHVHLFKFPRTQIERSTRRVGKSRRAEAQTQMCTEMGRSTHAIGTLTRMASKNIGTHYNAIQPEARTNARHPLHSRHRLLSSRGL